MTPILASKAKEIIVAFLGAEKVEGFTEAYINTWLATPQAAAILSGEDWISVEQKPEKKGMYLTFDPNYLAQPRDVSFYDPYNDSWSNSYGDAFHPSHYMALPEPPKP